MVYETCTEFSGTSFFNALNYIVMFQTAINLQPDDEALYRGPALGSEPNYLNPETIVVVIKVIEDRAQVQRVGPSSSHTVFIVPLKQLEKR